MITSIQIVGGIRTVVNVNNSKISARVGVLVGPSGASSWTPVLAVTADGSRRVIEVLDWVGGDGTKPDLGYLGTTGVVPDLIDAVDIRGAAGVGSSYTYSEAISITATHVGQRYFTTTHPITPDNERSLTIYEEGGAQQRNHLVRGAGSEFKVGATNKNRVYFISGDYGVDGDLTGQLSGAIVENDLLIVTYNYV
jgi:hypothetical protein